MTDREQALESALRRALPWLGRLIADKGHLNAVCPNDAIGAMLQAHVALGELTVNDALAIAAKQRAESGL